MSSRRLQRLFALLMLLALPAFAATGCGGSDESSDSQTTASDEPITITVWDGSSFDRDAFRRVNAEYMRQHPNVTVKRVMQPGATYPTLVRSAIAAQKGPDAFMSYASPAVFDFQRGIEPLGDLRTDADRDDLIGWANVSTSLSEDGTPYAMPWSAQGTVPYYNRALFRRAGLDPDSPPQTWPELLRACDALSQAGIVPIAAGFKDGYYAEWLLEMFGPQYQTEDERLHSLGDPDWTSPAMTRGLELIKQLDAHRCFTPDAEGVPLFPDTVNAFKSGKAAMFVGLVASAINWTEFRDAKVGPDLGVFRAPLVPGSLWSEPRLNYGPGLSWAVTRWSKNKQATYDYLSYLASADVQDQLFGTVGLFPNNRKSRPSTDDPVGQQLLTWATTDPRGIYIGQLAPIRTNVEATFDRVVPQIITGAQSVDDAMAQVNEEQARAPPIPTN